MICVTLTGDILKAQLWRTASLKAPLFIAGNAQPLSRPCGCLALSLMDSPGTRARNAGADGQLEPILVHNSSL